MKIILGLILIVLSSNLFAVPVACEGSNLISERGNVIYQFTFNSDCQDALLALKSSRYGLFCDNDALIQIHHGVIAYTTFRSDCDEVVREANKYRGLFCNDGDMMNFRGRHIRNFTFKSECLEALESISQDESIF